MQWKMENALINDDTQVYIQKLLLPIGVFLLVFVMLGLINVVSDPPLLLLERIFGSYLRKDPGSFFYSLPFLYISLHYHWQEFNS